jgi:hypothetical protein
MRGKVRFRRGAAGGGELAAEVFVGTGWLRGPQGVRSIMPISMR